MFQSPKILLIMFLIGCLLAGCTSPAPAITPTIAPSATAAPTMTPAPTLQPSDTERKLTINGVERSYMLHIPPGLDSFHPVPVVFAFHGFDQDPATMEYQTGFNDIANQASFIVVYPEGVGLTWNAGEICCGYALENNIDEIAFVRQILSELDTAANIDPKRIYAAGGSYGGALSYRLACEMSDVFAAVASVTGVMTVSLCEPPQPVSLIHVHGLKDTRVPYAGGQGLLGIFPPTEEGIITWVELNGCKGSPQVEKEKIVTHTFYTSCNAGTAVELYTIEAGGHEWPSKYVWPASQVIWDFFAAHPKP